MKFGLQLPSAQPGASSDAILSVAKRAEELGLDSVWMFDHLFTPSGLESKYPYSRDGSYPLTPNDPFFDPLGLFGVLASATQRVQMGTAVLIAAYRHPIVLAKVITTIENFAPGRILLGLGAGWMREEFEAVGLTRDRRGARLTEYITALRQLWSGQPTSFDGEFYSWGEAGFLPAPTQPIPIIVGGHADAALKRAATVGDGWAVSAARGRGMDIESVGETLMQLARYREERGRAGEPFEVVYSNLLWFSDEPNARLPLTGPPEDIAGSIKRLEEIGVTTINLMVFGPPPVISEAADRFAQEVLPLL